MVRFGLALLLAVDLGAGFGTASATVVSTTGQSVVLELHVEVSGDPDAVVAHLTLPGDPDVAIPMLVRDDGSYEVTTEVKRANYTVVFETLGGAGVRSEPVTLLALGADTGVGVTSTTAEEDQGYSSETNGWMWLAIAFGAASLAALAVWALGGRDVADDAQEPAPPESISAP
ncbi:MAG: hypothetical protein WB245_03405 [Acidimicrobiia bacterium]